MVDTATHNPSTTPPSPASRNGGAAPRDRLRVALAHDWLCGLRGGEMVLDQIARLVAREHEIAGLFVMFDDSRPLTANLDALPHFVSRVGRLPVADRLRRWLLPMYPRAVEELSSLLEQEHRRRPIDLVISTSSAAIKGLRPPRGVPHLCYCHSPARYVWSLTEEYAGGLRGLGLLLLGGRFRKWDAASAANVTRFVANSHFTARRIAACYGAGASVVHPAVRREFLQRPLPPDRNEEGPWLMVSALEPYKRVDLAIQAANKAGKELVIIGSGSQQERLRRLAGPTVRLLGRVSEAELLAWYDRARLLLFPQVEDFGLAAVEAQARGLPVVAWRDGGALESVVEGVTGTFFAEAGADALLDAVARCPKDCAAACRENAARFGPEQFDAAMRAQIEAVARIGLSAGG
jgi:glycosyltransferase involved in cell wall biosynthesis